MTHQASHSAQDLLKAAGLRNTVASRTLLSLFEDEPKVMLTHAAIDHLLHERLVRVNKVTVYRLLERFVANGLLRRVVDQNRIAHYGPESRSSMRVLPLFKCCQCSRLYQYVELPNGLCEALQQMFVYTSQACGHQSSSADLVIHGVCARCIAQ